MRRTSGLLVASCWLAGAAFAQVLSPPEILDTELRELQQKRMADLKSVAVAISSHQFPYRFYFSRKLDVSEEQERATDQRSIQFARFRNQVVLQITGNYFASYSAELMKKEDRARQTVNDVMVPVLKAAAPMAQEQGFQSFALEISHHVRKKTLGVTGERAENVVLTLPRDAVARLASASGPEEQDLVLREAVVLLDGQPVALWGSESASAGTPQPSADALLPAPVKPAASAASAVSQPPAAPAVSPAASAPAHDTSQDALKSLQGKYQVTLDRIVRDLDSQARFVGYAPPVFIAFHKGAYLQLSLTAPVPADADTSRYRSAAVAFDEHIASLIRPIMAYFKEDADFDGIDFSTTIRPAGAAADAGSSLTVEYIFSVPALRSYEQYDSTGQQLINSGFVLINGERVSLDLQAAESRSSR
ncbi:MAG: hypothetical protein ABSF98_21355 [Bryobacteraceae bacterium]|jgi:hypothetical protein